MGPSNEESEVYTQNVSQIDLPVGFDVGDAVGPEVGDGVDTNSGESTLSSIGGS